MQLNKNLAMGACRSCAHAQMHSLHGLEVVKALLSNLCSASASYYHTVHEANAHGSLQGMPNTARFLHALLSSGGMSPCGKCARSWACRLIDKKNARRYDDCISYSLVSAKKELKAAGLCQDANPDAVAKLDKTRAGAPCHPAPSRTLINALCDVG